MANLLTTIPDAAIPYIQAALPNVLVNPDKPSDGSRKMTPQEFIREALFRLAWEHEENVISTETVRTKRAELEAAFKNS